MLCVEAFAIYEGIRVANKLGLSHLLVLSDLLALVQILEVFQNLMQVWAIELLRYINSLHSLSLSYFSMCHEGKIFWLILWRMMVFMVEDLLHSSNFLLGLASMYSCDFSFFVAYRPC